jgi:hypothetical protein
MFPCKFQVFPVIFEVPTSQTKKDQVTIPVREKEPRMQPWESQTRTSKGDLRGVADLAVSAALAMIRSVGRYKGEAHTQPFDETQLQHHHSTKPSFHSPLSSLQSRLKLSIVQSIHDSKSRLQNYQYAALGHPRHGPRRPT